MKSWSSVEAKCRSSRLDPVELPTKTEQENFIATFKDLQLIKNNPLQMHIGAALLDNKWTWVKSNAVLSSDLLWLSRKIWIQ